MGKLRVNLRKHARGIVALAVCAAAAGSVRHRSSVFAQTQTQMQQPSVGAPFGEPPDPNDPLQRQRLAKMEKARNSERQQQLIRDTDKLLVLATQLKEDVAKSSKDTLSVDVVRRAAEIEKLAKSVKDRMRG